MKLVLLLPLALVAVFAAYYLRSRRAAQAAESAAARARARAAARRQRVPAVSSNLKGVTASQTISPYRPAAQPPAEPDDEVA